MNFSPNSSWRCDNDWEFQEDILNIIRTFYNSNNDSVKGLKFVGEDMLASIDDAEKLKIWDVNTGLLKQTFVLKSYESTVCFNESVIVITESIGTNGFKLHDINSTEMNFIPTYKKIKCLAKNDDGCLMTCEESSSGRNFIRIWKINGITAEEIGKIWYSDNISSIKYIGNQKIAVVTCNNEVKIYDLSKLKEIKALQTGHLKDLMMISEDRLALLTVCEIVVYDIENFKCLRRIERSRLFNARSSLFIKIFGVKPGQFGVLTSSYAYVFNSSTLNCIASINASYFHAGGNVSQIVALKDGRFASANKNEISIFEFYSEKDAYKKRKIENDENTN